MSCQVLTYSFHGAFCNSYLLMKGDECLLIDPGFNEGHILEKEIKKTGKKLLGILLTHGHFDHFAGLRDWEGIERIPLFMGQEDVPNLEDP
ncbi:MAG: MBL fold metallo-hydrolase, partial [Bacilli bacterium]|nr:MBL fold metallo-hydrolase [Bacilli bacterium]